MRKLLLLSLAFLSLNSINAFGEVSIICIGPTSGLGKIAACVDIYNPDENQVCTVVGSGKVCSTDSLSDLCYKVGKKSGTTIKEWSSGYGSMGSLKCGRTCETQYAGRFEKFGGKCVSSLEL